MCGQNLCVYCCIYFPFDDFQSADSICIKVAPNHHTNSTVGMVLDGLNSAPFTLHTLVCIFLPKNSIFVLSDQINLWKKLSRWKLIFVNNGFEHFFTCLGFKMELFSMTKNTGLYNSRTAWMCHCIFQYSFMQIFLNFCMGLIFNLID